MSEIQNIYLLLKIFISVKVDKVYNVRIRTDITISRGRFALQNEKPKFSAMLVLIKN